MIVIVDTPSLSPSRSSSVRRQRFALATDTTRTEEHPGGEKESVPARSAPLLLVNDMNDGPLKDTLLACSEDPHEDRFLDRPSRRRPAVPRGDPGGLSKQAPAWARASSNVMSPSPRTRAGVPPRPERSAHDHEHSRSRRSPRSASSPSRRPSSMPRQALTPASAECRTTDLTLAEFKTLRGKMDGFNPRARLPRSLWPARQVSDRSLRRTDERTSADPPGEHRADRQAGPQIHAGAKSPVVTMPFNGFHAGRCTHRR